MPKRVALHVEYYDLPFWYDRLRLDSGVTDEEETLGVLVEHELVRVRVRQAIQEAFQTFWGQLWQREEIYLCEYFLHLGLKWIPVGEKLRGVGSEAEKMIHCSFRLFQTVVAAGEKSPNQMVVDIWQMLLFRQPFFYRCYVICRHSYKSSCLGIQEFFYLQQFNDRKC